METFDVRNEYNILNSFSSNQDRPSLKLQRQLGSISVPTNVFSLFTVVVVGDLALYIHELCKMLTVKDVADHMGLTGKIDTCGVRIMAVGEIAISTPPRLTPRPCQPALSGV